MHYNLLENSNFYVNTTVGNVDIDISDLVDIINLSGGTTISGTNGDVLCLEADLAARVKIDEIRYYFSSPTASGSVSPTVSFYYKNEEFESYSSLNTNVGSGYYYTTVSGKSAPHFVRLIHTVSGTAVGGTVNGFSALNDDEEIDFGTDGSQTSTSLTSSVYGDNNATITNVPVYNDSLQKRTAYVTIEPQGNSADELLSISTTSGCPWIGVRQDEYRIADKDENDWNYGTFEDTETDGNNRLVLSLPTTSGTYRTKVFYSGEKKSFIDVYDEITDSMVTKDPNKEVETLEIRSSNVKPENYSIYRRVYFKDQGDWDPWLLRYRDYWKDTGALKYESGDLADYNWRASLRHAYIDINARTGRTAFAVATNGNYDSEILNIHIISNNGSFYDMQDVLGHNEMLIWGGDCSSAHLYNLLQDTAAGLWFYFYVNFTGQESQYSLLSESGYHLVYLNSSFTINTNITSPNDGILYDCDVVYDTRRLWYTALGGSNQVVLIGDDGNIVYTHTASGEPRGICTATDDGCWFIDYDNASDSANLVKLDAYANQENVIENVGGNNLTDIVYESSSLVWVRDGNYIKRIFTADGSVDFSVLVPNAHSIDIVDGGVWVYTSENYYKFINKQTQLIERSFSDSNTPGFLDLPYNTDIRYYSSRFPTEIDSVWGNLDWNEVRSDKYELSYRDERYHQVRVTLRADDSGTETPLVNGIYLQKSIELPDIYPGNSKDVYVRSLVPTQDLGYVGSYNSNLKAWWEVPTNV